LLIIVILTLIALKTTRWISNKFADSAVIIKARTKTKTRPIRQWAVGREFNRILKKKFDEKDIEIPFPHLTFYAGRDKKGESPPLRVIQRQAE
jgi:moderate conductance mechanosensitive channel